MFTKIGDVKIELDFNKGVFMSVKGPQRLYYYVIQEYTKNNDRPKLIEGHQLNTTPIPEQEGFNRLKIDIEFYMDFEIVLYSFDYDNGIIPIYSHRYNDRDKYVQFNLVTENFEEAEMWEKSVLKYSDLHGCQPIIVSQFDEINHRNKNYFLTHHPQTYKTYNIGRFPKQSRDFKTYDFRGHGNLYFGNWKKFWSYQHPRIWSNLNSQEIVDDILGL